MNLSVRPNERITFKVRHEDADVAVVDKPAGVVTQPGKGHEHDTLLNGLFARWGPLLQNLGKGRDYGLLHRLDRATSDPKRWCRSFQDRARWHVRQACRVSSRASLR